MKAYVNGRNAVAAAVSHLRKPRFRRRVILQLERGIHRVSAHLPSRGHGLRRRLPLRH